MTEAKQYTTDDIHINSGNFLSRQICVDWAMPVDVATRLLNQKDECGTTNGWVFSEELGEVQCEGKPEKKHMVFGC
jgi:hypothetical protein